MTNPSGFWAGALEAAQLQIPTAETEIARRAAYLSAMTGLSTAHALDKATKEHAEAAQAAETAAEQQRFRAAAGNPSHMAADADSCPYCGSELFSIGTPPVAQAQARSQDPAISAARSRDPRSLAGYHVRCSNFGCRYPLPPGDAAVGGGQRHFL